MKTQDMIAEIKKAPLTSALELDRLRLATTIGDTVLPEFEQYLDGAESL